MENDPTQDEARRIKQEVESLAFDAPETTFANVPKKVVGALHNMVDNDFKDFYGWCLKNNRDNPPTFDLTFLKPTGILDVLWRGDATKGYTCGSCEKIFCPLTMERSEHGYKKCPYCNSLAMGIPVNIKSKNKIDDFIYNKETYPSGSGPLENYGSFEIQVDLPKHMTGVCRRKNPMLLAEETDDNIVLVLNKNKQRKYPVMNGEIARVKNTKIIELTETIKVTWYQLMDNTWIHNLIVNKPGDNKDKATPETAEFKILSKQLYDQDLYGILVGGHFQYPNQESKGSFIYAIDVFTGMGIRDNGPQGFGFVGTVYSTYAPEKFDLLCERYHNDPMLEQSDAYAREMEIGQDDVLIIHRSILEKEPKVDDVQKYVNVLQGRSLDKEEKAMLGNLQRYIKYAQNMDSYKIFGRGAQDIVIFVKKDKFGSIKRPQQEQHHEATNQHPQMDNVLAELTDFAMESGLDMEQLLDIIRGNNSNIE